MAKFQRKGFFIRICQRAQNMFFCGGKNPLKYIPMSSDLNSIGIYDIETIRMSLSLVINLKETLLKNPPLSPIKLLLGFCSSHICCKHIPIARVFADIYLFICMFTICKPSICVSARNDVNGKIGKIFPQGFYVLMAPFLSPLSLF